MTGKRVFLCFVLFVSLIGAGCIEREETYEAQNISVNDNSFTEENMTEQRTTRNVDVAGVNITAVIISKQYQYSGKRSNNNFSKMTVVSVPGGESQVSFDVTHERIVQRINNSNNITLRNVTKINNSIILNEYHGEVNISEYNAVLIQEYETVENESGTSARTNKSGNTTTVETEVKLQVADFETDKSNILMVGIHERKDNEKRDKIREFFKQATVEEGVE